MVIGILIALQINNWNENAKLRDQEMNILTSLKLENAENMTVIESCLDELNNDIQQADYLQRHLGPEYSSISVDTLNYILGAIGTTFRCQIETDVIDELRSSGNLKLIQNQELRQALSKRSRAYLELKEEEEAWEDQFADQYLEYTYAWISWDDIDLLMGFGDSTYTGSPFDYDPKKMLQEFEHTNQLNNLRWRMRRVGSRLEEANRQLNKADSLITIELR